MSTTGNWRGPNIVKDGLVLYIDPSSPNSYYPKNNTIIKDISGYGKNGTLTNGPTYDSANGGSILFDGTNDYVAISGSITLTEATFLIWIKRIGIQAYAGILHSRGGGGSTTGVNFISNTYLGYHWNDAANTYNWNSGLLIPEAWCMVALSCNPTAAVGYLGTSSGFYSSTNSVTHLSTTLSALSLGKDNEVPRNFTGYISTAQLYNRALSSTEVQQNFNATKSRFGL